MLFLALTALAGTSSEVDLSVGARAMSRTDLHLSPKRYTGVLPHVGLGWDRHGAHGVHAVDLGLSLGSFRSQPDFTFSRDGEDVTTGASATTMVDLQYALGHRFDGPSWSLYVGATNANHIEDLSYGYGFLGLKAYFGAFELGPWVEWRKPVGEHHTFEASAWVPVAAWISRNPYPVHNGEYIWNTRDNKPLKIIPRFIGDGSLRTVDVYQAGHLRARWRFDFAKHWSVALGGTVDVLRCSEPRTVVETLAGLDARISGRF
ncbi:MAG: hypothetical protein H6737_24425 [Alphaproteobacteria bacterium]|nr:hypothetical protein [Alphaproteobacteria bacterium]